MSKILSFKDLLVWQKAIELSVEVYKVSVDFPSNEIYGLTNQLRRAANSVSLNIAEGHGRNTTKTFIHFLNISKGSLNEVETALILSEKLGFITGKKLTNAYKIIEEESKMIFSLIDKLNGKTQNIIHSNLTTNP